MQMRLQVKRFPEGCWVLNANIVHGLSLNLTMFFFFFLSSVYNTIRVLEKCMFEHYFCCWTLFLSEHYLFAINDGAVNL